MTVLFSTQPETHINNWYDTYLSETKKTGYICTFQLLNEKQRFFGLNDLKALLKLQNSTDTYLSLNAFDYGTRESKALRQIRNIGIDIDCYKKGAEARRNPYVASATHPKRNNSLSQSNINRKRTSAYIWNIWWGSATNGVSKSIYYWTICF